MERNLPPVEVVASADSLVEQQFLIDNPLHNYASWTYLFSLHMLNFQQFNNAALGKPYSPANIIVPGAGRHGSSFGRADEFQQEFFIDNFRMRSVVGHTFRSKQSNIIEYSFTIYEPNGFSFVDRLIETSKRIGNKNWVQDPYMLQLDFYSADLPGKIEGLTKYLPINIVSMKTKLTEKGTEYDIKAVPYHHKALSDTSLTVHKDMPIKGEMVIDYLGNGDDANVSAAEGSDLDKLRYKAITGKNSTFKNSGLIDEINRYYQTLKKDNKVGIPNKVKIIVAEEIGKAQAFPNWQNNPAMARSVPNDKSVKAENQSAVSDKNFGSISFKAGELNVPRGSKIDDVISFIVDNSSYIRDQLTNYSDDIPLEQRVKATADNTFRYYKILPVVKIIDYDKKTNNYSYDMEYHVKPYLRHVAHPETSKNGQVQGYVKEYNYIYTGKNRDVLDLQIEFNLMYYNAMSITSEAQLSGQGSGTSKEAEQAAEQRSDFGDHNDFNKQTNTNIINALSGKFAPSPIHYTASDTSVSNPDNKSSAQRDLVKNILRQPKGEMINVKLKIIGDPTLFKQDDCFITQGIYNTAGLTNGSISYDNGELYVFVNFKSPNDYDETTGLANPDVSKYGYSPFSGKYAIVEIEHTFSSGKFEQTLNLVRLPVQEQELNNINTSSTTYQGK